MQAQETKTFETLSISGKNLFDSPIYVKIFQSAPHNIFFSTPGRRLILLTFQVFNSALPYDRTACAVSIDEGRLFTLLKLC